MTAAENKAILRKAIADWNNGELEEYLTIYSHDCVLHMPNVAPGLEGIRQFYRQFWAAFPDSKLAVEDEIAADDRVAARFSIQVTHKGEFFGTPATGKTGTLKGITILKMADGKCVERWSEADVMGLLQQLGIFPG